MGADHLHRIDQDRRDVEAEKVRAPAMPPTASIASSASSAGHDDRICREERGERRVLAGVLETTNTLSVGTSVSGETCK
jgi:hypothetical protein